MQGRLTLFGVGIGMLAACAVASPDSHTATSSSAGEQTRAAPRGDTVIHHKPQAPVNVVVRATETRPGAFDVTLEATPWADVDYVTVTWVPPQQVRLHNPATLSFGPTNAGVTRSASMTVELIGSGEELIASVRVGVGRGIHPTKLVELTLGTPQPPRSRATRVVTLPSGEMIEEVIR